MHFQCYLLDGIVRWNEDRALAAVKDKNESCGLHTYNSSLKHEINRLSKMVYGEDFDKAFSHPGKYTGFVLFFFNWYKLLIGKQMT